MTEIERYSRMIDDFAWYGKGDIFEIAKLAKKLNRQYMADIAERKLALPEISKPTGAYLPPEMADKHEEF